MPYFRFLVVLSNGKKFETIKSGETENDARRLLSADDREVILLSELNPTITEEIAKIFETIRRCHEDAGYRLAQPWTDWPRLNPFFATTSRLQGAYVVTNEKNMFERFACENGEHPCLTGSGGDHDLAFRLMQKRLQLRLEADVDDSGVTCPGHRTRYWKIGL